MTVLFANNEYFKDGEVCQQPLKSDVVVCCEVKSEEDSEVKSEEESEVKSEEESEEERARNSELPGYLIWVVNN